MGEEEVYPPLRVMGDVVGLLSEPTTARVIRVAGVVFTLVGRNDSDIEPGKARWEVSREYGEAGYIADVPASHCREYVA